jgi:hypothetical protein
MVGACWHPVVLVVSLLPEPNCRRVHVALGGMRIEPLVAQTYFGLWKACSGQRLAYQTLGILRLFDSVFDGTAGCRDRWRDQDRDGVLAYDNPCSILRSQIHKKHQLMGMRERMEA